MTGFGRAEASISQYAVVIEAKSVNHRYLDCRMRLPSFLSSLELPLQDVVKRFCQRGSLEVVVRTKLIQAGTASTSQIKWILDTTSIKAIKTMADSIEKEFNIKNDLSFSNLLSTGKVILAQDDWNDNQQFLPALKNLLEVALSELVAMRKIEGIKLERILLDELESLKKDHAAMSLLAQAHPKTVAKKLMDRIKEWNIAIDSQKMEQEIAFYAERCDICEELERLKAHFSAFENLCTAKDASGRKLDFLIQEMHRETNTISSKSAQLEFTQRALSAKASLEKLREQVQNVE